MRSNDFRSFLNVKNWTCVISLIGGAVALFYYLSWWIRAMLQGHSFQPLYLIGFIVALLYCATQFVGPWLIYIATFWHESDAEESMRSPLSVDVFIPIYNEPYDLVEKTLTAASNMQGNHKIWLLDDSPHLNDSGTNEMEELAIRVGANYRPRWERYGNKAGNVNAAFAQTDGDVIALFDVDHAPKPDYLTKSLPKFIDDKVGFVQVMLSFRNSQESWVAQSATDASLDYYNPTSIGLDALGCAIKMGTNSLIRRKALEELGGYQHGLSEDLSTSLALHAAGWESAYVAEPLAPGLIPNDLISWFTQQLKWSRGVFEVQLTEFTTFFSRLSWAKRLSYGVRTTYYWAGLIIALHLSATLLCLFLGTPAFNGAFQNYLLHLMPLGLTAMLIRREATKRWLHPEVSGSGDLIGATSLVYSTWPIYLVAWMMAIFRIPLSFMLTPKDRSGILNPLWLLPQALVSLALIIGSIYVISQFPLMDIYVLLLWTAMQTVPMVVLLWQWNRERKAIKLIDKSGLEMRTSAANLRHQSFN